MAGTVRVGVVGLGWPGQRHLEAYQKNPQVEIVGVCDANPVLRATVQEQFRIVRGYDDLESLLAQDDLDAVSICTPNFLHEPMTRAALGANKHVLCEKPLAANLAQGERLAAAARESDRVCMVGFGRRFREDSRAVKALIDVGDFGQIYHARAGWLRRSWNPSVRGWFLSRELSGGGPLIDLGVHMLDLSRWFMGNPKAVAVSGAVSHHFGEKIGGGKSVDVEDLANAYVRLDNGATLMLETSWFSFSGSGDSVFCQLLGTKGGARLDQGVGGIPPVVEVFSDRAGVPLVASPIIPVPPPGSNYTQLSFDHEIDEFIAAIREGRAPSATVEQGLEILRILDAIYRSAESGAEVRLDR